MSAEPDVLVLGAGIHGAGVAQAAAAAGHSVLVLEQESVAHGTSSRSSKLIHGGLRYLEQFQLGLVRECLRERELLLQLAPELVRLRNFHIPLYRDTRRRPWQLRTGLSLYALLAGLGRHSGFHSLPRRAWDSLDGLAVDGLQAVYRYQDGQTDDLALTRAVLRSAEDLGAEFLMPAQFLGAELDPGGVTVRYLESGREQTCRTRVLVNATGPWVAVTKGCITGLADGVETDLVQGSHLLLDMPEPKGIYYLEVPEDGRAVFLMPWKGAALLGTTEVRFAGDPAAVAPSPTERGYLMRVMHRYFPQTHPRECGAFAGLRVLPHDSARPFERGRELILGTDRAARPRVVSLYGGKLTSYRADALKVLKRFRASLPSRKPRADTRWLPLTPVD